MFTKLLTTIDGLQTLVVSDDRKNTLQPLIDFIQSKIDNNQQVNINFICTHNSRRSHLSQIWSQALASYFNLPNVYCYSGGTETTAMFPMIAKVLEQSGFQTQKLSNENNPIYAIKYAENIHPIIGFSKRMDSVFNPTSGFAAVMTCSQADAGCPFVPGAEKRIPITFEDPKVFDGTPEQEAKYKERSLQIAAEMYHVFSSIKQ
ncbi:low molecular weight phosphatase family protein [Mangrovimonas cancribranchiae]|uniref:Protein-tyrosine-phosphatase n=1 Tax=Mangrovimonas cancribranchiae TaxID=3080055 RepID=A0AAU6NWN2_9FLAO